MRRWSLAVTGFLTWVCLSCADDNAKTTQAVQPTASAEVIVIGAGFAGLVAADRLVEEGVDVILLEKEDRVGGKLLSVPLGGTYANLGTQYLFYGGHPRMSAYLDLLPLFVPEGDLGAFWDGQLVTGADEFEMLLNLPLPPRAMLDMLLATAKMELDHALIAMTREFFFDKEPEFPVWMTVEGQSAAQYLSGFHPDVARVYNMFVAPEGGGGVSETTALLLAGWYAGPESEGGGRILVQGGNQGLTELVKEGFLQAGGRLVLSCEVAEVTDTGEKVHVRSNDGRLFESNYAVVATPTHVTKEIVQGLTPAKLEALEEVQYGPIGIIALHLACLPTPERLFGVIYGGGDINGYIDQTVPSGGNGDTETVISVIMANDEEALYLDDADLVQRVAASIQGLDPGFDPDACILDYAIQRWFRGIPSYTPGFLSQYQEALREPLGRIHFAGDYTHDPALSGAAWSGVRAAEQVLGIEP
jgi:monoamine oxidase